MASPSCNSYQKTIHQFYLQLRDDLLRGQLYCHEEAIFNLGGLALQAETGDYNDTLGDEYFLPEHYIPSKVCTHIKGAFVWDQSGIRIIGIMQVSVCLGAILIPEYLDSILAILLPGAE